MQNTLKLNSLVIINYLLNLIQKNDLVRQECATVNWLMFVHDCTFLFFDVRCSIWFMFILSYMLFSHPTLFYYLLPSLCIKFVSRSDVLLVFYYLFDHTGLIWKWKKIILHAAFWCSASFSPRFVSISHYRFVHICTSLNLCGSVKQTYCTVDSLVSGLSQQQANA